MPHYTRYINAVEISGGKCINFNASFTFRRLQRKRAPPLRHLRVDHGQCLLIDALHHIAAAGHSNDLMYKKNEVKHTESSIYEGNAIRHYALLLVDASDDKQSQYAVEKASNKYAQYAIDPLFLRKI